MMSLTAAKRLLSSIQVVEQAPQPQRLGVLSTTISDMSTTQPAHPATGHRPKGALCADLSVLSSSFTDREHDWQSK